MKEGQKRIDFRFDRGMNWSDERANIRPQIYRYSIVKYETRPATFSFLDAPVSHNYKAPSWKKGRDVRKDSKERCI